MTVVVSWLVGFGRFWYHFVIGDDWTIAAAVVVSLSITELLQHAGVVAWWLMPLVVVVIVGVSLVRRPPPVSIPAPSRSSER